MDISWVLVLLYVGVMPATILICGIWLIRDYRHTSWLKRFGIQTKGSIMRRRTYNTRPQVFIITYYFHANNPDTHAEVVYKREQNITDWTYQKLEAVNEVDIIYAPNNPNDARLWGIHSDNLGRQYALFIGLSTTLVWLGLLQNFLQILNG